MTAKKVPVKVVDGVHTIRCWALECTTGIDAPKVFCGKHWKLVPSVLRFLLADLYVAGEPFEAQPDEFQQALTTAIQVVAQHEGKMP